MCTHVYVLNPTRKSWDRLSWHVNIYSHLHTRTHVAQLPYDHVHTLNATQVINLDIHFWRIDVCICTHMCVYIITHMYLYIYMYICHTLNASQVINLDICIQRFIGIRTYTYLFVVYIRIYICKYVFMYVCISIWCMRRIYIHTWLHMYIHACIYMYICMYIYVHIFWCMYIHMIIQFSRNLSTTIRSERILLFIYVCVYMYIQIYDINISMCICVHMIYIYTFMWKHIINVYICKYILTYKYVCICIYI